MKVKVHTVHFNADMKLIDFIEERVDKLSQLHDSIIKSEVFLRLNKSRTTDNKVTEIQMLVPGKKLFAKKQCKSFEEATDMAIEALRKQLRKQKDKTKRVKRVVTS